MILSVFYGRMYSTGYVDAFFRKTIDHDIQVFVHHFHSYDKYFGQQLKDTLCHSEPRTDAFHPQYPNSNEPFLCQKLEKNGKFQVHLNKERIVIAYCHRVIFNQMC
jgi:hypothetical protein